MTFRMTTRLLAMLLTCALLLSLFPMSVLGADDESEASVPQTVTPSVGASTSADVTLPSFDVTSEEEAAVASVQPIGELLERRGAYEKHIRMSDGSVLAVSYPSPVHWQNEDGVWVDMDNTVTESSGELSNALGRVKLTKKVTGNRVLLTLKDGSYQVKMGLEGAIKGTTGHVENAADAEELTELQKMLTLSHLCATVTYADIMSGIDLAYELLGTNVKENLIVKAPQDAYTYTFTLNINGLVAAMQPDGGIELADSATGDVVYIIPAPVVLDGDGCRAPADAASYTLSSTGATGEYTLTVTASADYMNAEGRVYPVTNYISDTVAMRLFLQTKKTALSYRPFVF